MSRVRHRAYIAAIAWIEIWICAQVEDPNDVVDVGQKVYVKVVEHREMDKISLSMKVVDQATGEDLDPTNAGYQPSGGPGGRGRDKIVAGDELDPMEAQRRGLAPQSQRFASGGDYALVEEDRAPPPPPPDAPLPPMGRGRGATMPAWMSQLQADVGGASKKKKKEKDKDKDRGEEKQKDGNKNQVKVLPYHQVFHTSSQPWKT